MQLAEKTQVLEARIQCLITALIHNYTSRYGEQSIDYEIVAGTKYYKLVMVDHPGTNREGRSVHAFIARQTGAVYKPASFKAPAKHVRYNLLDEVSYETCLHNADWNGAYLYMK